MKYVNQLWQADTMFGPYCDTGSGSRKQTKLIAFLDDASRVLCHGEFFFEETVDTLVQASSRARLLQTRRARTTARRQRLDLPTVPRKSPSSPPASACLLRHTAVRDAAAAKGKIERFFRRVRDQFLVRTLDLSSLDALNRQFTLWVEQDYNATPHDAIGLKPIDRFGIDLSRVKFLTPSEHHDELFYAETVRTVKKDNTFSFHSRRYETPADLRGQDIQLRHDRPRENAVLPTRVIVYHKGQRIGPARLLDPVANGLRRRKEQP